MKPAALFIIAYLVGSLNFSILLFKCLGRDDPRKSFSRNPGVTNVYRLAGPFWASVILFFDLSRGAVTALATVHLAGSMAPMAGLGLIMGNCFPLFHGFRGGKGVAGYLGFGAGIAPLWALTSVIIWLATFLMFKKPFISSFFMVAILGTGVLLNSASGPAPAAITILTMLLILLRHGDNIRRMVTKG